MLYSPHHHSWGSLWPLLLPFSPQCLPFPQDTNFRIWGWTYKKELDVFPAKCSAYPSLYLCWITPAPPHFQYVISFDSLGSVIFCIQYYNLLISPLWFLRASLMAQIVKNPPAMHETWVRSLDWEDPLEKRIPTPVFLPGKSHGQRSLVGYSPWGHKESETD